MIVNVPQFIQDVQSLEGIPFRHQGRNQFGLDCVGLIILGLRNQGIHVEAPSNYPTSTVETVLISAIESSGLVTKNSSDQPPIPGDILIFRMMGQIVHVAVALKDGNMIHATRNFGVRAVTMSPSWQARLAMHYTWR